MGETAAENLFEFAELLLLPRGEVVGVSGENWDATDLARFRTAIDFYRMVQGDKAVMVKAVVEDLTLMDIVRLLY